MAHKNQVASAPRKNHPAKAAKAARVPRQLYETELYRLQAELVKAPGVGARRRGAGSW